MEDNPGEVQLNGVGHDRPRGLDARVLVALIGVLVAIGRNPRCVLEILKWGIAGSVEFSTSCHRVRFRSMT